MPDLPSGRLVPDSLIGRQAIGGRPAAQRSQRPARAIAAAAAHGGRLVTGHTRQAPAVPGGVA
jgi:hypothetical protein